MAVESQSNRRWIVIITTALVHTTARSRLNEDGEGQSVVKPSRPISDRRLRDVTMHRWTVNPKITLAPVLLQFSLRMRKNVVGLFLLVVQNLLTVILADPDLLWICWNFEQYSGSTSVFWRCLWDDKNSACEKSRLTTVFFLLTKTKTKMKAKP